MAKKKRQTKKTTKTPAPRAPVTRKASPEEAARLKLLDKEKGRVDKAGAELLEQMEVHDLTGADLDRIAEARAELVAAREHEKDTKEQHGRARDITAGKVETLEAILAELFPLPDDDDKSGQMKLDQVATQADELPDRIGDQDIGLVPFLSTGQVKTLKAHGLDTVRKAKARIEGDPAGWYKTVKGIGDKVAHKLANQLKTWIATELRK